MTRTWRLGGPLILLLAVIAILVAADVGIVAYRLASFHPAAHAPIAQSGPGHPGGSHPCNHGAYVSTAAHAHKGGGYVSKVAKSNLGKNGSCSAA
jgi:uncharacterized membrane protein